MTPGRIAFLLAVAGLVFFPAPAFVAAEAGPEDEGGLSPHVMLRSLQYVQDSVVLGDHSAAELQHFMLQTIDARLRAADRAVFDDPRNVDAALIYAMSGGNPATLEYLATRDLAGNFDNRVADILRNYLSGKGQLAVSDIDRIAREYRDERIGPYLALVGGNLMAQTKAGEALRFYDWVRLTAPGTSLEEAALRRSLAVCVDAGMAEAALAHARRYARRFIHSPYASQVANLFVQLVASRESAVTEGDIDAVLDELDVDRRRETFLRIARAAIVAGKVDLARFAASRVEALGPAPEPGALAAFYGNLADLPGDDVVGAIRAIGEVPDAVLAPRDRALRDAARAVADQVLALPSGMGPDGMEPGGTVPESTGPASGAALHGFLETGRSRLKAIDAMLQKEGYSP